MNVVCAHLRMPHGGAQPADLRIANFETPP